jgi:hypothetical protein
MKHHTLFFILLVSLFFAGNHAALAESGFFDVGSKKSKETPVAPAIAEKITSTIKELPEEGAFIKHIDLIEGIRAMDGEIASAGEIKIMVNLNWQSLASHPDQRKALDNAAAHIVSAVFSRHNDITKLRVIVKIPNNSGNYESAAKVFSFTRATWELIKNDPRYKLETPTGVGLLLALGDYVILTAQGWTRGY